MNDGWAEADIAFSPDKPENVLQFSGLDLMPVPDAIDSRSMGIGLRYIECSSDDGMCQAAGERDKMSYRATSLNGIIYTSVFNPGDDRKNWLDMVKAFCSAFQKVEDATLVLKMTHHSLASFIGKLHFLFQTMWPFQCRIVAMQGYLDDAGYEKLISATSFYVNTARCEGLCLPLMEFMSCGKPAIAPCHTSLADYVESSSTLIVKSGVEPGIWPHDERDVFRALRYRIDWASLRDAFVQSYDLAKNKPQVFRAMGDAARERMKAYSSNLAVKGQLNKFLNIEINS